jgi:hypothetical protein
MFKWDHNEAISNDIIFGINGEVSLVHFDCVQQMKKWCAHCFELSFLAKLKKTL